MELLEKLKGVQDQTGYISAQTLQTLAAEYGKTPAEIKGIASFYSFFRFAPGEQQDHIENQYPLRRAGLLLTPTKQRPWEAYQKSLKNPEDVIPELNKAGLTGRSGSGFPAGTKWALTQNTPADCKYIICNADEGEPGTGKDRLILQYNPEAVIEGMAICGAVMGAQQGYIYLRGEYEDLKSHLEAAIAAAPLKNFTIEVRLGHGAYICGEETALLNSLESNRGETRLKPPFPGVAGYLGRPTVINNVETWANVSYIAAFGAEAFRSHGTKECPGTRLYTLCGSIKEPGVYEMESGTTVGQLLQAAGGMIDDKPLKAVQVGGGSGSIIPGDCLAMAMTPASCAQYGCSLGTASLYFLSEDDDLTAFVQARTAFYAAESCGMCVPCRNGLQQLLRLLKTENRSPEEQARIPMLAEHIAANARCAMGRAAVTPVISILKNFPEVLK